MLALLPIPAQYWVGFIVVVLFFLAFDLGVFHRHAHVVRFREALAWTTLWFVLAMYFGTSLAAQVVPDWGAKQTEEFIAGYITELSLSMDNVFVMAVVFGYFGVPSQHQHRVLFWGILGALIMRGLMIALGAALVARFEWLLYVFGAFLLITGVKMVVAPSGKVNPEANPVIRLMRRFCPISKDFDGQKFLTRQNDRRLLTPLALVLLMVETTDLVFALDSLPAIFGLTKNAFIIFTSNVFAILGLRSLYFVLANAIDYFRYLKAGLTVVLGFIGVKMLLEPHGAQEAEPFWFQVDISTGLSLIVVGSIITVSILASVVVASIEAYRKKRARASNGNGSA
jgi:tellurite resistance protein TerC